MTPTTNVTSAPRDTPPPLPDAAPPILWRQFTPRGDGVLDLVDDVLARCVEGRVRLVWGPGSVTEFPLSGAAPVAFAFAIRNSAFRALLARMSVLCDGPGAETVSPYGGRGAFTDPRWPHVRFWVDFTNTPAEQRLDLTPAFTPEPS